MTDTSKDPYVLWREAEITKEQLAFGLRILEAEEASDVDLTLVEAARAHWMRKGAESILRRVFQRKSPGELAELAGGISDEMDFGSDKILREEFHIVNDERKDD